jgi:hypothetical protein
MKLQQAVSAKKLTLVEKEKDSRCEYPWKDF